MPPRLINIEHIGDIDQEPSSELLNLEKVKRDNMKLGTFLLAFLNSRAGILRLWNIE